VISFSIDFRSFDAKVVNELIRESNVDIDFIGFHGQTIFHNADEKISRQLGDGKLLSQLTKKTVVYDFRQNDLKKGGHGAPLAPIFHQLIVKQNKIDLPVCILNIGGIANITAIGSYEDKFFKSYDIGPGNCLIDQWIRLNSTNRYDQDGEIARSGKINKMVLNSALENYPEIKTILLIFPDLAISPS
jgi:anhydro-N-acetylmuramic acid kinase